MVILVSDTSVLIDLDRGGLLEAAFNCELNMVVPDLLYDRELANDNGPWLRQLGLGVVALTPPEVSLAQEVQSARPTLSLPDCFALSCATRDGYQLVTNDKALRSEAQARLGQVFGLFWILDQMAASGKVSQNLLYNGLTLIAAHPRCRLPAAEIKSRLNAWRPV